MYEINFNSNNEIHPATNIKNKASSKYDNLKAAYKGYLQKMDKSDFANSLTRYQIELNLLIDMYKFATEESKSEELAYIEERYNVLVDNFKQFGITPKELN